MTRSIYSNRPAAKSRRGFTLIELLVVILILGILMVVALPVYNGAVADANHRTCRANMQTIANAEQAYYTRSTTRAYTNDLSGTSPLIADLGGIPKCPQGGTYSITTPGSATWTAGSTTFTVHCSYGSVAACFTAANNSTNQCPAPAHDAPYVSSETDGFTLNVNTQ
jgi:type IV pilus assembly protein PilA